MVSRQPDIYHYRLTVILPFAEYTNKIKISVFTKFRYCFRNAGGMNNLLQSCIGYPHLWLRMVWLSYDVLVFRIICAVSRSGCPLLMAAAVKFNISAMFNKTGHELTADHNNIHKV